MFDIADYPLPYDKVAAPPFISEATSGFHHDRHLAAYINNLNNLIKGTALEGKPLEHIIRNSEGAVFNNAAQVFNHDFFFRGIAKDDPTPFPAALAKAFGGKEGFLAQFKDAANSMFGSGWAWLALSDGAPKIIKTANADTPLAHGMKPVLTLDLWEHAYYLDYQNRRTDYVDAFLRHLVNWKFVSENL